MFEKLLRWAVVAFAVRCGYRVLPLFERRHPDDSRVRYALQVAAAYADASAAAHAADLAMLKELASRDSWTDGTPVDSDQLGPLWPEDQEPEWAKEQRGEASGMPEEVVSEPPQLEIYLDPGNASVEVIQEFLESLNALNIAYGGEGYEFKMDGGKVYAVEGSVRR